MERKSFKKITFTRPQSLHILKTQWFSAIELKETKSLNIKIKINKLGTRPK